MSGVPGETAGKAGGVRDWAMDWMGRSRAPVIVGPWRSEVGFETLYWLPFLAQWRERYHVDRERLIVLSRGGAGAWYGAGRSVELYDYVPAQDLRLAALHASRKNGSVKQLDETALERHLIQLIAARLNLRRYHVLHPSRMYRALEGWWHDRLPTKVVLDQLRFTDIPTPAVPLDVVLPERFVAVRWYHRYTFPMNDDTLVWAQRLTQAIAQQVPVVVLTSSLYQDDHWDFPITGPNITVVGADWPARENLAIQSAVIARSVAFVGTYGGTMQLAVRLRKPSAGFFLDFQKTAYAHKMLTEWLGTRMQVPVFIGRPQDADFVRQVVPVPITMPAPILTSSGGV